MKLFNLVAIGSFITVASSSKEHEGDRPNHRVSRNLQQIISVNGVCNSMIPPSFLAPDDSSCWQWWTPPTSGVVPAGTMVPQGCDYQPCQDAVCACDDYCCNSAWDLSCRGYYSAQGDGMQNNYFVNGCSAKILCCEQESAYPDPPVGGANAPIAYGETTMNIAYEQNNVQTTTNTWGTGNTMACPIGSPPPDNSNCWQWWTPPSNGIVSAMEVIPKGCDHYPCQNAVCAYDPYCCDTAWDGTCRLVAQDYCCEPSTAFPKYGDSSMNVLFDQTSTSNSNIIYVVTPAKKSGTKKSDSKKCKDSKSGKKSCAPTMSPVMSPVKPPVLPPTTNPPGVSLSTSKLNYANSEAVMVMFTSPMALAANDWVGIYNCDTYINIAYQYTGGATSGTLTFGPGTVNFPYPNGCYFAEYYSGSNVAMADVTFYVGVTGTPVMTPTPVVAPVMKPITAPVVAPVMKPITAPVVAPVMPPKPIPAPVPAPVVAPVNDPETGPTAPGAVSVTTDKSIYNAGETIVTTYTNPSPMELDWIGLFVTETFFNLEWENTGGASSGVINFSSAGLASGNYFMEYYNGVDLPLAEAEFTVIAVPTTAPAFSPGASITTSKPTYALSEQIVVNFSNNAPTTLDWIGIYNGDNNLSWDFTGGIMTGQMIFGTGLANFPFPPGSYYATYFNGLDVAIAEVIFVIN